MDIPTQNLCHNSLKGGLYTLYLPVQNRTGQYRGVPAAVSSRWDSEKHKKEVYSTKQRRLAKWEKSLKGGLDTRRIY